MGNDDPTVKAPSPYERKIAARLAGKAGSGDPTRIPLRVDPRHQRMEGIAVHGHTPFSVPFVSQIEGNLWQGGCQNGLVLPSFFEHVISLYPWEQYTVTHDLKSILNVRMYDSEAQGFGQVNALASWVRACTSDGPTLVHCQAGLNRSSLVAARALMLDGRSAEDAITTIRTARSPACLCNPSFEAWLRDVDPWEEEDE